MPCWTIVQTQVQFLEKSTNLDLLKAALEAIGFTVQSVSQRGLTFAGMGIAGTYDKRTGSITTRGTVDINLVKRQYAKQVAISQAKKHGWSLKWSTNAAGNEVAEVIKRRF
jgi:hypothetical protein